MGERRTRGNKINGNDYLWLSDVNQMRLLFFSKPFLKQCADFDLAGLAILRFLTAFSNETSKMFIKKLFIKV